VAYQLVPLEATQSRATVWVGVSGDPPGKFHLNIGGAGSRPLDDAWTTWDSHGHTVFWAQRVTLDGLAAGTSLTVSLSDGASELATATLVTLPVRLPSLAEPGLGLMLGSCFAHEQDVGGVGAAFSGLPALARPQLKILCGDQVYLDAPFPRFLITAFGADDLQAAHLQTYLETWGLVGGRSGIHDVLGVGATYFSSDDHEYWNNAFEPGAVVRNTWGADGRSHWQELATRLFQTFQTSTTRAAFEIGELSFLELDTRIARAPDRSVFMPLVDLEFLRTWVAALAGPGVLIVGQVVFADQAGWKGRFADWGLPDFAQYGDLVRILATSRHDIVVLTGDVHFGRVAGCVLPTGANLLEIISSPLALVDKRAGGTWHAPPGVFPAFGIPGTTSAPIWCDPAYRVEGNHFATIELHTLGPRVRMTVRAWPIPANGARPVSSAVFERDLD